MAPLDLSVLAGTFAYALPFVVIGMGFGAALEMGGFGDTRKLAAQFYLRDVTVLKVMFTGIVVAGVLVAAATSFGLLDMSRVWVNPTYLWPGIVGGLIMGVGFILGGFCPGTSVVAASTLKIDGMFFLAGVVGGIWAFGETVGAFEPFFLSSYMGRFTVPEWLGLPTGVTVLLVVAMALAMFWLGGLAERHFGKAQATGGAPRPRAVGKLAAAGALVTLSVIVMAHGQPTPSQKFDLLGAAARRPLAERAIFVHPAEVVALRNDITVQVAILDLRDEHDFNLFHIGGSTRLAPSALGRREVLKPLLDAPATTVNVLVGTGEDASRDAWKQLRAQGVGNLYVLEGGVNRWLALYPPPACAARPVAAAASGDAPAWRFAYATGANLPSARPEVPTLHSFHIPCEPATAGEAPHDGAGRHGIVWPTYAFTKRVKLQAKSAVKGGCG
jgi:rhodanese-related sulfurtransferase